MTVQTSLGNLKFGLSENLGKHSPFPEPGSLIKCLEGIVPLSVMRGVVGGRLVICSPVRRRNSVCWGRGCVCLCVFLDYLGEGSPSSCLFWIHPVTYPPTVH